MVASSCAVRRDIGTSIQIDAFLKVRRNHAPLEHVIEKPRNDANKRGVILT